ncbi:helix-turn-helix transcriptional regulator [Streptomyces sp. PmtG]
MVREHGAHSDQELCEAGHAWYVRALDEGRVRRDEADLAAPCALALGLLRPDPRDGGWLRPAAPATALARLLQEAGDAVAEQRGRQVRLAASFESLLALPRGPQARPGSGVTVREGLPAIQEAVFRAAGDARNEILTIQPGGQRPPARLPDALPFEQGILDLGGRIRTLYQHTTRHSMPALAHYEQLAGDVEVRSMDELPERLIVFDRTVAFLHVSRSPAAALELRRAPVASYLAALFELLWRFATPMYPRAAELASHHGVTPRQQAIAALLTEGLTDAGIAERLGMNVRTTREHIAKLATVLGSTSRAQLGYLIGQSGILDHRR